MLAQGHVLNNRYRIVMQIGQGGFGSVYRAWDMTLNRACAIKENTDFTESTQRQFEREAQVLGSLSHPNLVKVLDLINIPGEAQYLVMEYIDGEDLDSLLQREHRVDSARAIEWIIKVCAALIYLHEQNPPIVHRDIKPANIRLTPTGEVVLVDFGLVKVYSNGNKTTMGARAVTPGYSPPEQYGHGTTDARTDVYALAATLYSLLTGDPPEESVQRLFAPVLRSVHAANPQVSSQLDLVLAKGLNVNAANRYQTIKAFQQALESAARPVVQTPAYPSANVGMNRSSVSTASQTGPVALPSVTKRPKNGKIIAGVGFGITILGVVFCMMIFMLAYGLIMQNRASQLSAYWPTETSTPKLPTVSLTPWPTQTSMPKLPAVSLTPWPTQTFMPRLQALTFTPWPQSNQPVTSENASQVTQLARWGKGSVSEVAYSPDGMYLAVASSIGVYLHDAVTFAQVLLIESDAVVSSVAFSPDGQMLASGSDDNTIRLWRVSGRQPAAHIGRACGLGKSVAFSPDGQRWLRALMTTRSGCGGCRTAARCARWKGIQMRS
jgi:eukaryotic-like serine/threonine-protein kinase